MPKRSHFDRASAVSTLQCTRFGQARHPDEAPTSASATPHSPALRLLVEAIISIFPLTPKTAEVAIGMHHGLTKREISVWLHKSISAVDALERQVRQRLGAHTRASVAVLIERGLGGVSIGMPNIASH